MKRGGKVKGVSKARKARAVATATNTVHVHLTKRQSAQSRPAGTASLGPRNHSAGNIAMERQLGAMFQKLGQMSFHPPVYASYPPLIEQGANVLPKEVELPHQQKNIINLADLAREPILEDIYRGKFAREEWNRQEQFSHASHLPSSIDHGDPAEVRSLPFSRVSYGDENNQEVREIPHVAGQMSGGYYGDYENFVSHPNEVEAREVPMSQSVGNVPFPKGEVLPNPFSIIHNPRFPPLHRLNPKGYIYGEYGLGYTQEGKPRSKPIRNDEYSEYSAGFPGAGMNPPRPGRQYYVRPFRKVSGHKSTGDEYYDALEDHEVLKKW